MYYSVTAERKDTEAVVATFKTFIALKAPNTKGNRGRLRRLTVGADGEGAQDINVAITVSKTDNDADATGTAKTIKDKDGDQRDSIMTAIIDASVEPTTIESENFWAGSINGRGLLIQPWERDEAPRWGKNETLVIRLAPGTANIMKMTVTAEWEED